MAHVRETQRRAFQQPTIDRRPRPATIPILTRRALERAPAPPPPTIDRRPLPTYTPTPGDRVRQTARQMEHNAYSETMGALERQQAEWDAERKARLEAQAAAREARAAESERTADYHQAHLDTIGEAFAPSRAEITTVQALAFNPKYQHLPPSELWELGRQEDGRRNAIEFGRTMANMSPQEQQVLGPLSVGLHK